MSTKRPTYGQVRRVLSELGFKEIRKPKGVGLEYRKSDILFLFRPYKESDRITPAELFLVEKMLDERGMLEPESFETLLAKAPA